MESPELTKCKEDVKKLHDMLVEMKALLDKYVELKKEVDLGLA